LDSHVSKKQDYSLMSCDTVVSGRYSPEVWKVMFWSRRQQILP